MGRTGLTGPRGQNGTSGSSGSSGQDGTSGVDGQDGTSGINGRKGDKGDKGDRGFPGLQGPAGAKGEDGVIGSSGTSGVNGATGPAGSGGGGGSSVIRLANQTLSTSGWYATGSYYGYTFSNVNIGTASNVDFIPYNDSNQTAIYAQVMPYIYSGSGFCIIYSNYTPGLTMSGDVIITPII
jgi:hypothetical protein